MSAPLWRRVASRRMLWCVLAGFASGLPLYVVMQLVPAWLQQSGVDLGTIGLLTLVQLPYTWKLLWAPLLDRYDPVGLGRRRSWALLTQGAAIVGIGALGQLRPDQSLDGVVVLSALVAFASASQDIALDAWRRELLDELDLGLGNAVFVNAYRVAGLIPGGVALVLADQLPWSWVFPITASFLLVGLVASLIAPAPIHEVAPPASLRDAVIAPLRELFGRGAPAHTLRLLAFMVLYKLGDNVATALITPFYLDVGFSMTVVGSVAKTVGLGSTIMGALVGGLIQARIGIARALWWFGGVQLVSILGFAGLAVIGPQTWALVGAVAFEYLGVGLGTTALVSWLQASSDRRFTATQYALFSSLVALPRTVVGSLAGYGAEALGWPAFFLGCTLLAVPGLLLLPWVAPWPRADGDGSGVPSGRAPPPP